MGFAARLTAARSAQEAQKGPITMDQTTKMIHEAISKAVQTNKLEPICTAQEVLDTAKHLGRKWDMNAFCEKYALPPQIAADLLQVHPASHETKPRFPNVYPTQLSLFDLVVFIDDSGSMNEGTKWADCAAIVTQIVELCTLFDSDGIGVRASNPSNICNRFLVLSDMCRFAAGVHEQRRVSLRPHLL